MKKRYNIPHNWQDFEDLCKELWRKEWDCREIQSHGRNGQTQHGVDIFGIPDGETQYYGIQCKHKSAGEQLTESEIDSEINKAKGFPTELKMLYIATTADNDANVQKYAMQKDVENRVKGSFGIRVYSWQEICDILRQHKSVLDWYLSEKFSDNKVELIVNGFSTTSQQVILKPKYKKNIKNVVYRAPIQVSKDSKKTFESIAQTFTNVKQQTSEIPVVKLTPSSTLGHIVKRNKSLIKLTIDINNIGEDPFENFYLFININEEDYSKGIHFQNNNILVEKHDNERMLDEFDFSEKNGIINSGMMKTTTIYINLPKHESELTVTYHFNSKNYKTDGKIEIKCEPEIEENIINETTANESEVNVTETIENIIEENHESILESFIFK